MARSSGIADWFCPQHGRVGEADLGDGHRCIRCGSTALDANDPANRDALAYARASRAAGKVHEWHVVVVMFVVTALPFAIALTAEGGLAPKLPLAAFAVLFLVMWLLAGRERDRAWREPGHFVRTLTSTPSIAIVVCVAFVAVKHAVGVEELWYAAGDPIWRTVTATFTHGGAAHLIGNMFGLAMFGFTVDRRIGRMWTAVVLAVSAATAMIAWALTSSQPAVGFSGAVYGMFGATLALLPTRVVLLNVRGIAIPLPTWAWMCVFVPAFTIIDALDPSHHVAWTAHLGGFAGGLLVALPMRRVKPSALHVSLEERRATWMAQAASEHDIGHLTQTEDRADAASSNPEIAAFHRAARRRRKVITAVAGTVLVMFGSATASLAGYLEAPELAKGRRIGVIVVAILLAVIGLTMLGSLLRREKR